MRTKKAKLLVVFIVVAVSSALLITSSKTITNRSRITLSSPGVSILNMTHSILSGLKRIIPFASFREENRVLRERIELLSRRIEEMKVLADENERLKNLLNFKNPIPYATIPAQVIGRDPSNWSSSLIIDKGSLHGIRQGNAVLSTKGLVGRLVEIGRYSSKILLITDPNSKVGVVINRNRQGGILIGRPDGKCKMIYIALDSDVTTGDKVITGGFGSVYPKDILVGEVVGVGKEPGRLYKYAIVKTAEDLSKLEEVLCIR